MASQLDRRRFLRNSAFGGAVVLGGPALLAACGDDTKTTTAAGGGGAKVSPLDYQLSWLKNAEFAGNWIASEKGFYKDAGFDPVNFIAGGPGVQQEQSVVSGKALVGISGPDITGPAILKGAPLIALGALFQKNPFCFMSLASKPIKTAKELEGVRVGIQDVNTPVWKAFVAANKLDESKITVVPVQFDPQGLVNGEVDAWFSFVTNEPNALRAEGIEVEVFLLADQGYPLVSQILFTKLDTVKNDREKLKALLKADIMGWRESLKDPALGAGFAVDKFGKDLGLKLEAATAESKSQNELILTADTKANGIFTVSNELLAETITSLGFGGVKITEKQLFDFSVLEEVYAANPELKKDPTA